MPRLVLPDPSGGRFDFQHQSVAGDTLVLWLAAGAPAPERLAGFAALAPELEAVEARGFLIAARAPAGELPPFPIVLDPDARLRAALGLKGTGILVADPRGRIAAVLEGEAFGEALERAAAIHGAAEPALRRGGAPALIIPDVLEPELRARLIDFWQKGEKLHDTVSSSREAHDARAVVKKRSDVAVTDKALFGRLKDRLLARVVPEMHRAFGFEAASFEALRIGCYDAAAGGFFRRHRDNSTPYTAHRKFAMSLNLNTGEYEGGELRFPEYGGATFAPQAGGAVVFSCSLLHEATPVTSGRRFAFLPFLYDEAAAKVREANNPHLAEGLGEYRA
jgi:predicted 2-oxoglutarate/Fe(II)-dependent dioxygenase YbiX